MSTRQTLTPAERAERSAQQCRETSQHDELTAALHAEAARLGITPAALARTKAWREKLAAAAAAEPTAETPRRREKKTK